MITILAHRTASLFDWQKQGFYIGESVADDAREWLNEHVGLLHTDNSALLSGQWDILWAMDFPDRPPGSYWDEWVRVRLGTDDEKLAVYFKLRWC